MSLNPKSPSALKLRQAGKIQNTQPAIQSTLVSLGMLILFIFAGWLIFQFIAAVAVLPFFGFDIVTMQNVFSDPLNNPESKIPFLVIQGIVSLGMFVIAPLLFIRFIDREVPGNLGKQGAGSRAKKGLRFATDLRLQPILLTIMVVILFMPLNSVIIEWNANIKFPEILSSFEQWAAEKELMLKELTNLITDFTSFPQFLLGVLVIAIIPAAGEELVFRGLIQNKLFQLTKNWHIAIWISAFLFSAIHMQFYGFFPRMLLGIIFGYLYLWSGNLLIPVIAHFVNNCFTAVIIYLRNLNIITFDIESTEAIPIEFVILSLILTIGLIYWFRKYYQQLTVNN
ncbi:MAG: CPBP family intramembrane metalloprotease [Bacteroidetes bacterium]|nr:CPBP family intramembrane metalloprotease [Bacteroidota bacterium]